MAPRPSQPWRRIAGAAAIVAIVAAIGVYFGYFRDEPTLREVPRLEGASQIPKIDVHVHVPASQALSAVEVFERQGVVLSLNASGGQPGAGLARSAEVARTTRGRLLPYCNIDLSRVEDADFAEYARATIDQCREEGAVGLKIFKSLGLGITLSDGELLRVDDPRLDIVFERAGANRLPVLIHTGDPQAFFRPSTTENERYAELSAHPSWSFYGDRPDGHGQWPSWQDLYDQFEARVARHPATSFLGAHFGNAPEDPALVDRMLDRYPNLYVETGARIPEIGRHDAARMRRLFVEHQDRILFGTDFQMSPDGSLALGSAGEEPDSPARIPFFYRSHYRYFETNDRNFEHPTPIQGDWRIDGIGLPRSVLTRIYHRNAMRLFGVSLPE